MWPFDLLLRRNPPSGLTQRAGLYHADIAAEIQADVASGRAHVLGEYTLTANYLATRTQTHPLADLVWAYVRRSTRDTAQTLQRNEVVAEFVTCQVKLLANQNDVSEMIEWLARHAPWAFFGWSDERGEQYYGGGHNSAISTVASRRQKIESEKIEKQRSRAT